MSEVQHTWFREVATELGLPHADRIPEDPGSSPIECWETVQSVCGLGEAELLQALATHFDMEAVDPYQGIDRSAARLLPEKIARWYHVVPVAVENETLVVATAMPGDPRVRAIAEYSVAREVVVKIMSPYAVDAWVVNVYGAGPATAMGHIDADADAADDGFTVHAVDAAGGEESPEKLDARGSATAHLVSVLFSEALALRASDIHMQPIGAGGFARFRVDGVLGHGVFLPNKAYRQVLTRIKALARMDISDPFRPQDGRIFLDSGQRRYDIRISSLPVGDSHSLVMRILDPSGVRSIEDSGFSEPELSQLRGLLQARQGVILLTGPTGSGKSTTLHTALSEINTPDLDIHTIEDPVEYTLHGAVQVQVDTTKGVTFASALRSILRQDPDVILVGEIRDEETARISAQAALTGHLVLSTLHTNDAPTAIPRLLDLGVAPSYLAEVLTGVVAQRLVRKLCQECSQSADGTLTGDEERFHRATGHRPAARPDGCGACHFTGYSGRLPVAQVLVVTPEISEKILDGADLTEIRRTAFGSGMRSLAESAASLVERGLTTVDEAARVLGARFWQDLERGSDAATTSSHAEGMHVPADAAPALQGILLIDASAERRDEMKAGLQELGYQVTAVASAEDVWRIWHRSQGWRAVVLDVEDGDDPVGAIEAKAPARLRALGLPLVIVTESDGDAHRTLEAAGFTDFVDAPASATELSLRLGEVMQRQTLRGD